MLFLGCFTVLRVSFTQGSGNTHTQNEKSRTSAPTQYSCVHTTDGKRGIYLQCSAVTAVTQTSYCSKSNCGKSKPHDVQHSSCLLSTVQLNYSINKCQNSHLSFLVWVYLSLLFPGRHIMQILKNLSTPKEHRGIKHGVLNISLGFCKSHQSHNNSEFWGALTAMPGTIWKDSC